MLGTKSLSSSSSAALQGIATPKFAPSQAKIPIESLLLTGDQQTSAHVYYWDTPFTPLFNDVASEGLIIDVREPLGDLDGRSWLAYRDALLSASTAGVAAAFADANRSVATVTNGRVPNLLEYWSGGAPAWYGSTQRGRVAIHWRCVMRSNEGRGWFDGSPTVNLTLAFAGNGLIRVVKNGTTEVQVSGHNGVLLTETDYLTDGLQFTTDALALAAGDYLDIYYVQNNESWGGVVCKAVPVTSPTQADAIDAPVLGAGLFDSGTTPTKTTLSSWHQIEVTNELGGAAQASVQLPLINPLVHDGFGYEWRRSSDPDDPGYLVMWDGGAEQAILKRGRLVRLDGGLVDEEYSLFTGYVADFEPSGDGVVTMRCVGFEQRALKTITKNEPDPISYMTFGYKKQKGTSEPVYGIAAYDNWAIEYAVKDLLYRVGIDGSRFATDLSATKYDGSSVSVSYNSQTYKKFRARTLLGNLLRLERNAHYGNVGQAYDDSLPADDAYIFPPEATKEPWNRVREIGDRYGYDIRFDNLGDCVLLTRGNASAVVDVVAGMCTPAGTSKVHPSAFKGSYRQWTGAENPAVTFSFTGSRVDVSLPRGAGLGNWAYMRVVRTSDEFEVARVRNVNGTASSDVFFYDYRTTTDGSNATILTLFTGDFDTYRVECKGIEGSADGKLRRLDCFFVYATDPLRPLYPRALSTSENALSVTAAGGAADDQRNLVYVVGKRKATVTDSTKFETNPNNPDPEFIVEVAVDPASITNAAAKNYVGARYEAAIYDNSIGDPDYAAYIARTFVYRYRTPRPPADISHTILPVLELRDPLFAVEDTYKSVNELGVLWTSKFTHKFSSNGQATSTITTTAWPEFPSYEPREDIDIDDPTSGFNGVPIANVEVSYTSLSGSGYRLANLASNNVVYASNDAPTDGGGDIVTYTGTVSPAAGGAPAYISMAGQDWPPVPGTLMLRPPQLGNASTGSGSGTPYPNFADPHGGLGGTGDLRPIFTMLPGGSLFVRKYVDALQFTAMTLGMYRRLNTTTYALDKTFAITQDRNGPSDFWYDFNPQDGSVTLRWKATATKPSYTPYFAITPTYTSVAGAVVTGGEYLADNPYHHFTNIDYRDSNRKIYLPWQQGDSTSPYQRSTGVSSYTVKYRRLGPTTAGSFVDPYLGVSPFADVTAADLGYTANIMFDTLVSGFYQVSIRSLHDDTVVAYLTEPTADQQDSDAHWSYVTAGAKRSWTWDFSDLVGVWNARQSEDYAAAMQGLFELNEKQPIGAGWYVWNQERANGQLAPLALISGDRDSQGRPVFGQGTFAAWYVHIEVKNDHLEEVHDADGTKAYPRVVNTCEKLNTTPPIYTTASTAAIIYTHMPEPTQVEIKIEDWISGTPYDPTNLSHATTNVNWGAMDSDATIHNQKPVRVQFTVKPRPGALWSTKHGEESVKVTRHVHLRGLIFDQIAINQGVSYPGTSVEQRSVYTRRSVNDEHTVTYVDQGWRKAKSFRNDTFTTGTVQWVFRPADFKKKFGDIPNESIGFANYLQTEELPNWEQHRPVAGASSRYIIGFWGALFYLSAFVQDRSGRRMWCTNRKFLDKSKIVNNDYSHWWNPDSTTTPPTPADASTYRADWPTDPVRQQRRTVICRQWTNEPNWKSAQMTRWSFTNGSIGEKLLRFKWEELEPAYDFLNGGSWPTLDLDEHSKWHTDGRSDLTWSSGALHRQLGAHTTGPSGSSTWLGSWTWEANPLWIPNPSRDYHPYFLVPPMPDSHSALAPASGGHNLYGDVDGRPYNSENNTGDDYAAGPTWSSWCRDMAHVYSSAGNGQKRFFPGTVIDTKESPNKTNELPATAHDYVRQDSLVHYEDLRGCYSRGPRPAETPKKITPTSPYYLNPMRYGQIYSLESVPNNQQGKQHSELYRYEVDISHWFRLSFRAEYVVESSAYFPTNRLGLEMLVGMCAERTRFLTDNQRAAVYYDSGAWTGWKDDLVSGTSLGGSGNIFEGKAMPFQTGPEISGVTKPIYMHLCLVPERRAGAI